MPPWKLKSGFEREGYVFAGWNTKPDGSGESFYDREMVQLSRKADATVTLYAQWLKFQASETVNFADLTANYTAKDGTVLTGKLNKHYKISIEKGASVVLDNVTIDGIPDPKMKWAGLTCLGDCNIILAGGSVNNVRGTSGEYPGILVYGGYTLTIEGFTANTT